MLTNCIFLFLSTIIHAMLLIIIPVQHLLIYFEIKVHQSLFVYIEKTNNIEMPTHQKTPQCAIYLQRYVASRLDNVLASNTAYYY